MYIQYIASFSGRLIVRTSLSIRPSYGARGEEILDGGALSLFRFHISPFPPETPDTLATSGHIALLFFISLHGKHTFEIILLHYCLPSFTNSLPKFICSARSLPLFLMKKVKFNS